MMINLQVLERSLAVLAHFGIESDPNSAFVIEESENGHPCFTVRIATDEIAMTINDGLLPALNKEQRFRFFAHTKRQDAEAEHALAAKQLGEAITFARLFVETPLRHAPTEHPAIA